MKVLILAAGYGTRLYPLTINLPKALISINEKPLLNIILDKVSSLEKEFSIEKITVLTNNRFYQHFLDWRQEYKFAVDIYNDGTNSPQDRLGAIGDINFFVTQNKIKDDLLILGADNIFDWGLDGFIRFSQNQRPYPTLCLVDIEDKKKAQNFGVVKLDEYSKVVDFKEKPQFPESTMVATCIYFFPRESLNFIAEYVRAFPHSDASGKYIEWLAKKAKVYGYPLKGLWLDIGHKEELEKAKKIWRAEE